MFRLELVRRKLTTEFLQHLVMVCDTFISHLELCGSLRNYGTQAANNGETMGSKSVHNAIVESDASPGAKLMGSIRPRQAPFGGRGGGGAGAMQIAERNSGFGGVDA